MSVSCQAPRLHGHTDAFSSIEKAFNPEWRSPEANSGYYWRITTRLRTGAPPKFSELRFSTSEPRVLPEREFSWLRDALLTDRRFVEIFAENCRREWQPLWCLEAGIQLENPAGMNVMEWLEAG